MDLGKSGVMLSEGYFASETGLLQDGELAEVHLTFAFTPGHQLVLAELESYTAAGNFGDHLYHAEISSRRRSKLRPGERISHFALR